MGKGAGNGRGGARKGAGRPKKVGGANDEMVTKAIALIYGDDKNLTGEALEDAVINLLAQYARQDIRGVQYLVERHLGKAVVKIEADLNAGDAKDADGLLDLLESIDE
jgi:hypothetical protein